MRNKTNFINDVKKVMKENLLTDNQIVEDAAHTMNQLQMTEYVLPKEFASTNKDEVFLFELKKRNMTNSDGTIDDYYYTGRGA